MPDKESMIFSDLTLARRLERAEGRSSARFVEARARAFPESGAEWMEIAGASAMYDGAASPLTQTFGLGVFETVGRADMERAEEFFQKRGAPVFHEVSPLADISLVALLNERGYQPFEFTSVMFRPIQRGVRFAAMLNKSIHVRLIEQHEHELWAHTAARGWSDSTGLSDFILKLGRVNAQMPDALCFLAESGVQPVATGALSICEGVGLLHGASTVPEGRKQGAQLALLDSRLRYAAEQGCDIAMMCAEPGSASQRNAERQGFRIAYTRIKWRLTQPGA